MKENKFLRINWFCVGTLLVIPLIFLKFWMWPPTTEIIVLWVFVSLNFLFFGVTNNSINKNGVKRTNYFFGFTIRKIDWNKIKFEMWNKRFGEGTNFDLDYGKLLIIGLLVYHIFFQG